MEASSMFMFRTYMLLAALAALAVPPVIANEDLARKQGCLACHSVDKKVVGPGFKEVAAKYRGDASAEARLIVKVKKGGSGVWGQIPMPPSAALKDEDAKTLVDWILSLK
jgi:cytochrome c